MRRLIISILFLTVALLCNAQQMMLTQQQLHRVAAGTLIPEFVQGKLTTYASNNSFAFTIDTTPVEGNLMLMAVGGSQARTVTFPGGWSQVTMTSASITLVVGYKIAGPSESTSVTVTFNLNLQGSIRYYEFKNADTNILLSPSTVDFTSATSSTIGSYNVTDKAVAIANLGFGASVGSVSINNGFSAASSTIRHDACYKIYSNPTDSETTTWSHASGSGSTCLVIFRGKRY